ncbi:MAG: glycosyltransferase [Chromatiaceae bacterium]
MMVSTLFVLTLSAAALWLYLLLGRGAFWRADQRLATLRNELRLWPAVVAVVPARNEAALLGRTLRSLRRQAYKGCLTVVLVDDQSADATASVVRKVASGPGHPIDLVFGQTPPTGWAGKVWAMVQGVDRAREVAPAARYLWFTDADVEHDPDVLARLVQQAERDRIDLVSTMVMLHCRGFWERLLVPAFVFFFQKLYPFPYVNSTGKSVAAAAGGSLLVRRGALDAAGGLAAIRGALIDDCALGALLKRNGRIWLGLTDSSRSLRAYGLGGVWATVSRTAFTELDHSFLRLLGVAAGMALLYLVPVAGLLLGFLHAQPAATACAALGWLGMTVAYGPTLRLYHQPLLLGLLLPITAALYLLMTLDSARKYRPQVGRAPRWSSSTDWRM